MLDEIKQKMHETIDKAWETLHGTSDVDKAREVAQATTGQLQDHVLAVEAHLFNHVADNANAEAKTGESAPDAGKTSPETGAAGAESTPEPAAADKPAATASGKKTTK